MRLLQQRPDLVQDIGHDVADEDRLAGQALIGQVVHGNLGGRQKQVRRVVRQDTVVLFRHAAVEGTQPRFEVGQRDVHLDRRDGRRQCGVGVAVDQDTVRLGLFQDFLKASEHRARLCPVLAGSHPEVKVGGGDTQVPEKDVTHELVIMLACVGDEVFCPAGNG